MPYQFTPEGERLLAEVTQFMDDHIYPNEAEYYEQYEELGHDGDPPIMEKLKAAARERGLWNLFLPHLAPDAPGTKLSNLDYAPISEQLGKVGFSSEALNCAAPDTGNMEILNLYGSENVKRDWLAPLLEGEIRSAFSMTEPEVASSDATNIGLRIERDGDEYVLNGTKWFSSGALRPRCKVLIVMGKTNPDAPRHLQQSMIAVPKDSKGISFGRKPHVFGYDHAGGHPEILYENVRVPAENLLGEEGGGFAISQARLGPGRIHHCMRSIGVAERALGIMIDRALVRTTFGTSVAHKGLIQDWIAEARIEHRHGPGVRAAHGPPDGHRRQQGRRHRDLGHQGRHPAHDAGDHRPGHPGPRCRRRHAVHAARRDVRDATHAAHRRRSRRGPQDDHRPARDPAPRPELQDEPAARRRHRFERGAAAVRPPLRRS